MLHFDKKLYEDRGAFEKDDLPKEIQRYIRIVQRSLAKKTSN